MQIGNMECLLVRSDRKTIAIQIRPDGSILVRAPRNMRSEAIHTFVRSKTAWIEKHRNVCPQITDPLSAAQCKELAKRAREDLTARAGHFGQMLGVSFGRIAIRCQKTRWGSCSAKSNLNFNYLLMLAPPAVRDYVVVHELCHLKHMNHSAAFWTEVERILPEYQQSRQWLKDNGAALIARLPQK